MANTPNLDLKRLDEPTSTTKFNYDTYVENNFEKVDAAMGASPATLTTEAKTIVPAIIEVNAEVDALETGKVDKVPGKGLSKNDFTDEDKAKLNTDIPNQVSEKVDKLKATNLVTNGDFSQGTTGWTGAGASIVEEGGRLAITASAQYGGARQNIPVVIGHKYYIGALLESLANEAYLVVVGEGTSTVSKTISSASILSNIFTASSTGSKQFGINNALASGWVKFYADNVKVFDLTETFGAGNEPTKEQMDRLLAEFPNSWFDGTQEVLPLKVIPQLLEEKANRVQEPWITPTLLNGATSYNGTDAYGYYKDQFGTVHLRGTIKVLTVGGAYTMFALPVGYRPEYDIFKAVTSSFAFGNVTITKQGNVALTQGSASWCCLTGISFKGV